MGCANAKSNEVDRKTCVYRDKRYELTDENLLEAERKVLALSGLPADQIQTKSVKVGEFKGEPVCIRTSICGDENKPKLVFIHGYGASGPMFYKIMQRLTQYFCVIFHDLIGMGGSSRPEDFDKKGFNSR